MSAIYNAGEAEEPLLDRGMLARPRSWAVNHRGLVYRGEVILAESVDPRWGEPLPLDICFRVVFYTVPRRIPPGQIRDRRIAIAVPRRVADATLESLRRELQAIHKAKARYVTGRDPGSQAIRSSIEERERSLLDEVSRREALSYAEGRVYTHSGIKTWPSDIFGEPSPESWVDRLVNALFLDAFHSLPFHHQRFPTTLTTELIAETFRGVLQRDGHAAETAARFGPPLGITAADAPTLFDASECPMIDVIEHEVGTRGGEMAGQSLLQVLCRDHGLNPELATLYVLAYTLRARAQIGLEAGHSIRLKEGGPFPGDRVSWDLVPELSFNPSMSDAFATVGSRPSTEWNAALPYAMVLAEGLGPTRESGEIAGYEMLLLDSLAELKGRLPDVVGATGALASGLQEDAADALAALDRLSPLCAATSYQAFHAAAVESFGGPSELRDALALYRRLERLAALESAVAGARAYLRQMSFGRKHQDLEVKRDIAAARIRFESLATDPGLWESVNDGFRQLVGEYAATYLSHHAQYHEEASELQNRLARLRPQIEALKRFDRVRELGGPFGGDAPGRFETLRVSLRTCPASEDSISLESAPTCRSCLLPLSEDVPRREVASLFRETELAMGEYNRRLSSEGVRRILAHPTKEQLEKFVDLVQVSDLSGLANILDDDVVDFLRGFLCSGESPGKSQPADRDRRRRERGLP